MTVKIKKLEPYQPISDIFALFYQQPQAVFLDSSLKGQYGLFSIIGLNPYLNLVVDETVKLNGRPLQEGWETFLKGYFQSHFQENNTELPLISGAIGYLSYDLARTLEKMPSWAADDVKLPYAVLNFYDNFIIENHQTQEIFLIANGRLREAAESLADLEKLIASGIGPAASDKAGSEEVRISSNFSQESYLKAIKTLQTYMSEDELCIANLTQRLELKSPKTPYETFTKLRAINPSPFGAYLNYEDFQVVCASPERFIKVRERQVETRPIKGTRKRGQTPEEDQALREDLQNSEKERSELLMVVDLERNDLSKVCRPGSVQTTEMFAVEEYATVFHLVSTVTGELDPDHDLVDLIRAVFPGGSITGAPKKRALEIIEELESVRRGLYTGSIGYFSLDGSCDLNVVIRTLVHKNDSYYLGVGGGITSESELSFEYEETFQKARALIEALK